MADMDMFTFYISRSLWLTQHLSMHATRQIDLFLTETNSSMIHYKMYKTSLKITTITPAEVEVQKYCHSTNIQIYAYTVSFRANKNCTGAIVSTSGYAWKVCIETRNSYCTRRTSFETSEHFLAHNVNTGDISRIREKTKNHKRSYSSGWLLAV